MAISGRVWSGVGLALLGGAAAYIVHEKSVEKPTFIVEQEDGAFSVRRYPPLLVAQTVSTGERLKALNTGFNRLAGFIFAKDRPDGDRRKIAMTAPVLSDRVDGGWRTRFVMPDDFTPATLPRPGNEVAIDALPGRRVAAIRFSGMAADNSLAVHERRLRDWLAARGLTASGPADYAFYNSPFVPGPLRRNEVLVPLAD